MFSVAVPVSQLGPGALSLDLIAQHCTLLPPELVSLGQVATFIGAGDQDAANNNLDTMDTTPAHIKEVSLLLIKFSLVLALYCNI